MTDLSLSPIKGCGYSEFSIQNFCKALDKDAWRSYMLRWRDNFNMAARLDHVYQQFSRFPLTDSEEDFIEVYNELFPELPFRTVN